MELIQLVVAGLGSGSIYVLAALGLVITYRVSNVVNFAQGAFAMATAFAYWDLKSRHGMPFLPSPRSWASSRNPSCG
jgi:branched-subunit amino acid ABC-type transport system permease component